MIFELVSKVRIHTVLWELVESSGQDPENKSAYHSLMASNEFKSIFVNKLEDNLNNSAQNLLNKEKLLEILEAYLTPGVIVDPAIIPDEYKDPDLVKNLLLSTQA